MIEGVATLKSGRTKSMSARCGVLLWPLTTAEFESACSTQTLGKEFRNIDDFIDIFFFVCVWCLVFFEKRVINTDKNYKNILSHFQE